MGESSRKRSRSREPKSSHKYKHKKKHKKSSKRESRSTSPPPPQELLIAAALGDERRCKKLLKCGADVHFCDDFELSTPLHAASRAGNLNIVKMLLKYGAHASVQDINGDFPCHLAARGGHLDVLAALLRSSTIGNSLHEPNLKGETVEQLTASVIEKQTAQAALAEGHQRRKRSDGFGAQHERSALRHVKGNIQRFREDDELDEMDEERVWQERLRREMSPFEGEAEDEEGGGGGFFSSGWHADEFESAEEYAKRIWAEMEDRKRRKIAFQATLLHQQQQQPKETEKKVLADKEEEEREKKRVHQQRKLEEQQAADAAWRAAVAAGSAATKLASYEARWEFFCCTAKRNAATTKQTIFFSDIPWIIIQRRQGNAPLPPSLGELEQVLLHGSSGSSSSSSSSSSSFEEQRQLLRRELTRWHGDKFISKFGASFDAGDREKIVRGVTETSQMLTQLYRQLLERKKK